MPAQVVVVKRSRRRAFAVLRAVPAWLRAIFATIERPGRRAPAAFELEAFETFRDSDLLAPERRSGLLTPHFLSGADPTGCSDCRRCVAVCPTGALSIATGDGDGPSEMVQSFEGIENGRARLDLDPGRCIGCGECVRACPEKLLELRLEVNRVGLGRSPSLRNLFAESWAAGPQ